MSFRSGFFNSKNHDKQYYASDISKLFNSLINPGVFGNVGNKFIARPGEGMQVIIPSGMAWFNSTWTLNDSDVVINIDEAPYIANYSRIDGIFLQIFPVDDSGTRNNGAYYMKGTETSATPSKPVPTATDGEVYVPICYVTVANGTTSITAAMIENCVGTVNCPFITGILETIDATELLTQWEAQWNEWLNTEKTDFEAWTTDRRTSFDEWFETIRGILDSDVAGHLQNEIDELQPVRKRTITNLLNPTANTTTVNGITFTNNGDGTYTLSGTASPDARLTIQLPSGINVTSGQTVKLVGCPSNGSESTYQLYTQTVNNHDYGNGVVFDWDSGISGIAIIVKNGVTVSDLTFKPMLTTDLYASYDEFVQYSGDGELNENVSSLHSLVKTLQDSFSNALTSLKNTAIAQAVGATGSTFTSVIAKLAEIVNRGAWSANMGSTGSVTIPAGYHDGTGTVKTNGTATITTNGTHNIAQYSNVNVSVAPAYYNSYGLMQDIGNRTLDFGYAAGTYTIILVATAGDGSYNGRYVSAVQIISGSGSILQNSTLQQGEHYTMHYIRLQANTNVTVRVTYTNENGVSHRTVYLMCAVKY